LSLATIRRARSGDSFEIAAMMLAGPARDAQVD
jgi:hypothetical protein